MKNLPPRTKDEHGHLHGKLQAVAYLGRNTSLQSLWGCHCECGNFCTVTGQALRSGSTRSCGCIQRGPIAEETTCMKSAFRMYRSNARRRGLEWSITLDEFVSLTASECHYCGAHPGNLHKTISRARPFMYNGIDRADNSVGYNLSNLVPCCWKCNRAKGNSDRTAFEVWIKKVYFHLLGV